MLSSRSGRRHRGWHNCCLRTSWQRGRGSPPPVCCTAPASVGHAKMKSVHFLVQLPTQWWAGMEEGEQAPPALRWPHERKCVNCHNIHSLLPKLACLQKLRMLFSGVFVTGSNWTVTCSGCTLRAAAAAGVPLLLRMACKHCCRLRLSEHQAQPAPAHCSAYSTPHSLDRPSPLPNAPPALRQQLQAAALQQVLTCLPSRLPCTRLAARRAAAVGCNLEASAAAPRAHVKAAACGAAQAETSWWRQAIPRAQRLAGRQHRRSLVAAGPWVLLWSGRRGSENRSTAQAGEPQGGQRPASQQAHATGTAVWRQAGCGAAAAGALGAVPLLLHVQQVHSVLGALQQQLRGGWGRGQGAAAGSADGWVQ